MATASFWVVAVAIFLTIYWLTFTRRPQDILRLAAKSEGGAAELRSWMALGMHSDRAFDALESLYEPLVGQLRGTSGFHNLRWPCDAQGRRALVLTLPQQDRQALGSIVTEASAPRSDEWTERVSRFAGERQMLMAALRRSAYLANPFGDEQGQNLVLDRMRSGAGIGMEVTTASYGQIVRTSDALINEFALFGYLIDRSAIRQRPSALRFDGRRALSVLPWRRAVHAWDPGTDLVLAPRGRASGLGVAIVLRERAGDSVTAVLARRSSNVGTYPDALHVIPAGMINTRSPGSLSGGVGVGALPRLTMLAEFLEECFDVAELSGHSLGNFGRRVERELADRGLHDLEPAFTGIAIDLLNLRTEICATMDMSGRTDAIDAFTVSWEFSHNEALQRVDLAAGAAVAGRHEFVQSGLGALDLAARYVARSSAEPQGEPSG